MLELNNIICWSLVTLDTGVSWQLGLGWTGGGGTFFTRIGMFYCHSQSRSLSPDFLTFVHLSLHKLINYDLNISNRKKADSMRNKDRNKSSVHPLLKMWIHLARPSLMVMINFITKIARIQKDFTFIHGVIHFFLSILNGKAWSFHIS